jgi:hypothetical protein
VGSETTISSETRGSASAASALVGLLGEQPRRNKNVNRNVRIPLAKKRRRGKNLFLDIPCASVLREGWDVFILRSFLDHLPQAAGFHFL